MGDFLSGLSSEMQGGQLSATPIEHGRYEQFVRSLHDRDMAAGLAYWKELLQGYDTQAAIPAYRKPTEAEVRDAVPRLSSVLDATIADSLQSLAARARCTLNTVMELAWGLTLHACCCTDDAVFAKVVSGRSGTDMRTDDLVGLFINSVPVRVRTEGDETVAVALGRLQAQAAGSARWDFCPLARIQAQTDLGGALFQSTMVFENYPVPQDMDEALARLHFRPVQTEEEPFNELSIVIGQHVHGTLGITIASNLSLYPQEEIRTVASTFTGILQSMAEQPDARIRDIQMVTEDEQAELIKLGTGERLEYAPSETLVSLFRAQAARTPYNIAVVFRDRQLTYRELDELTDRLAAHLINTYHVQPEEAVGIMTDRSELMAVYPLAVMKAGGAYMPLDFSFPEERLRYMCEDAGVRLILSEDDRVRQAMPSFDGDVFTSDNLEALPISDMKLPEPQPSYRYVILYTSGSTGRPKGVALEHHNIVNFCHWYHKEFRMTSDDRALGYSNFGFDAHMMDIYPALTCGASVYIIDSGMRMDIGRMNRYMEENAVSIAFLTTQVGHFFASSVENRSLRLLSVGGERLSAVRKPPYELYNCCGHTECTIYTTFYKIENDYDTSVIGRPLPNYQLFITDQSMRLLPCGVAGELIICGEGVGRGYLHPSEKDAARFTTFMGERCYRTGDLCRWNKQGELEYLGRIDTQVKLRGYRIELGEIESQSLKYGGIKQTVASVYNGQLLCLYYTADSDIDEGTLKEFLAQSLPDYMVPAAYIHLDELPLTPNGKVDRKKLPAPDVSEEEIVPAALRPCSRKAWY